MKKLTQGNLKSKKEAENNRKSIEATAEKSDAKCCAKTSKNRVGCHD